MIIVKDGRMFETSNDFVIAQMLKYGGVEVAPPTEPEATEPEATTVTKPKRAPRKK